METATTGMEARVEQVAKSLAGPELESHAVVSPQYIYDSQIITAIKGCPEVDPQKQVQQNGFDLRLNMATLLCGRAAIGESKKIFPETRKLDLRQGPEGFGPGYYFSQGHGYSVETMEQVAVPSNMCSIVLVRSTFNRCASMTVTGVWDSGFFGAIGVTLRPRVDIFIERGTRICQMMFFWANSAKEYNGSYQGQSHQYDVRSADGIA